MQISIGERPFTVTNIEVQVPGIPTGVALRPGTSDEPTFIQVFVERQYEIDLNLLQPNLIIDGGANIGLASLWFKNLYPASRIIAIEPEPSNCVQFRKNLHGYAEVQLLEGALWSKSGAGVVHTMKDGRPVEHWAFQVSEASDAISQEVRFYTIGEILRESRSERIDILKLDVEGAEEEIFSDGCEDWLQHVQVLILEFHELFRPNSSTRILERIFSISRGNEWRVSQKGDHFIFQR